MAFIKMRGVLVGMLVEIAPDVCKSCVTKDKKGVPQSLAQCQNALRGTAPAAMDAAAAAAANAGGGAGEVPPV